MSDDKGGPRDWDKELAEIDRLMAAGAADPPPVSTPPRGAAPRAGGSQVPARAPAKRTAPAGPSAAVLPGRRAALFTWLRLLLGVAVGAGITQWPYVHGCGLPLAGYLAGVTTVSVAACWSMVSSWRTRSGVAHVLSIGLLLWGVALGAREVLPRVGYAKQSATWKCEVPAAAPAPLRAASPPASVPAAPPTDSVTAPVAGADSGAGPALVPGDGAPRP